MARYVLLRLIQLLPVLFLASVGVWLMIYLIPGDPTIALLGADVTPEQLARARTLMGLDRPLPVQYALWLGRVVRGTNITGVLMPLRPSASHAPSCIPHGAILIAALRRGSIDLR
jgi:ABC-type dipeptide/oligopeptide/nickel transport system permease component